MGDLGFINGSLMIGSDCPAIKMKKLTGTTGAAEGSITDIAHGVTLSKIVGALVFIDEVTASNKVPPGFMAVVENEYDFFILATNVRIVLSATNSGSLLTRPITVLIIYEE